MVTLAMMFMLNILMAGVEKTQAGLTCTIIIKNMAGVIMDGVIMDGAIRNTMDGVIKNIMVGAGINTLINYGNWLLASAFAIQFY